MPTALVIGGTGPTGPYVVNGLIDRGYQVTIMHTGRHEVAEITDRVTHIHTNPFDQAESETALGSATYDLAVVMYGRLRVLAPLLVGRVGRLVTIGGVGAVRGWSDPGDLFPAAMTVPAHPQTMLAPVDDPVGKLRRIVETEQVVFDTHPDAIHLRYPMLYGPRQLVPREWPLVRRALDRRQILVLPDGGLTLKSVAYVENAAHAVMCAVDAPASALGQSFNITDTRLLTLAQVAEIIADELGHSFEIESVPAQFAVPARPLLMHWSSTHRVVNIDSARSVLGYEDVVEPEQAVRRTTQWLVANPPTDKTIKAIQDPFDYPAEDAFISRWRQMTAGFEPPAFDPTPGYGAAYYGRKPNPATGTSRVEPTSS